MGVADMDVVGEARVTGARAVLPTGTVTFVLTDIVGSARLWDRGGKAIADAVARHYALIDAAIASHGGVRPLEQGEGDSTVSAFALASDALRAAMAIQGSIAMEPWPTDVEIAVRIGVHTGEAVLRDDRTYFGEAITRAARIRDLGGAGQTLVSSATAALVGELEGALLLDVGEHELQGLSRPERVYQLIEATSSIDVDLFAPARPIGVPAQMTSFVGREREIGELRDALETGRVVTVVGTGGCGKTRLAIEVARVLDPVCWLDLSPLADPSLIKASLASALGLRDTAANDVALVEHLRERRLLLVLDNCEHLAADCAELVDLLIRTCEGVSILATSREALAVPGEHAWQVPSLSTDEAVALFADRAAKVRPRFAVTDENREVIVTICTRLDGIPLAIELAAARARTMTPQQIADGLADRFRLLTGGSRTALARQRTLEASVEWSHALLGDDETIVFRRLSVFAGGFTLEAAEAVCSGDGVDELAVLDLVTGLADRSLVHVEDDGRFRLLETMRDYARHKLHDAGEVEAIRNRHLAFFLDLAVRAEPELEGPRVFEVADALEADHDNIRAAIEWAVESEQVEDAFRLVAALPIFWMLRDHVMEAIDRVDEVVALDGGDPHLRVRAILAGSFGGGRTAEGATRSRALCAAGIELARQIGDTRAEGRLLLWRGRDAQRTERAVTLPLLEAARELAREANDLWCVAEAESHIGIASFISGDIRTARAAFARALDATAITGDPVCTARTILFGGVAEVFYGRIPEGIERLTTAMELLRGTGDRYGLSLGLGFLGRAHAFAGSFAEARRYAEIAVSTSQGNQYFDRLALAHQAFAELLYAIGELDEAALHVEAISTVSARVGDQVGGVIGNLYDAYIALAQARLEDARDLAASLRDRAREARYPAAELEASLIEAFAVSRGGHPLAAERTVIGALRSAVDSEMWLHIRSALDAIAEIAAAGERWVDAARLLAAADEARRRFGLERYPVEQPHFDEAVARTRAALGDDAFEHAWTEGARLSVDDVVEYVTRSRRERGRPSHGWEALTPTELQVVRLVREGLTNPQIAERLFNSPGTIRAHMSHIFAKVGVSTRAELAAEATRRDLEGDT